MLARARARRGYVVTPDDAVSPMDAASTQQIPRTVVTALDEEDAGPTASIPSPHARATPSPRPAAAPPLPSASGDIAEEIEELHGEGMVPTVQQSRPGMRSLSQRLGGE